MVPATATSTLDPDAYRARFEATQAVERLVAATQALAPFYAVSNGSGIRSANVSHRMMLAEIPDGLDRETGQAIARGLTGARLVAMTGDPTETAAIWWAVLASHGVTFRLLTVDEYRRTLALMLDAVRAPALGEALPERLSSGMVL